MRTTFFIVAAQLGLGWAALAQTITIPAGTEITVRTLGAISSKNADTSTEYRASVEEPVAVNGVVVVPAGANAWLRVNVIKNPSLGKASMTTTLVGVINVNRERSAVVTGGVDSTGELHGKRTGITTGVGAGTGAAIGSVGGLGGAAIGAGAGAAAGAVTGIFLKKKDGVTIPSETRYTYRLSQPVTIAFQGAVQKESGDEGLAVTHNAVLPAAAEKPLIADEPPAAASVRPAPRSGPAPAELKLGETQAEVEGIMGTRLRW